MQIQKKKRHSKFKNTGILFELLTQQLTADIVGGKSESNAKNLLFKYFKDIKHTNEKKKQKNPIS